MFLPLFHFPYFDISAVHMLIGDLNSSSGKLISKAERKKTPLVCISAGIQSKHNLFFLMFKAF